MKIGFPFKTFALLWLSHLYLDFFIGIWPIYKTLANLDIAVAGLIMGIAGFTGEMLQLGFGYLSDHGYRKKILIFGLLIASSILFVTFTSSFYALLALMLCLMIGSGSYHPAAVGIASGLFPKKGRSILFFTMGGVLGMGSSQVIFTKSLKWFNGHAYPLLFPLLILAYFWIRHPMPTACPVEKRPSFKEFFAPFAQNRRSLLLLYFSQVTCYGVFLTIIFLLPDILKIKQSPDWLFLGGGHMSLIFGSAISMLALGFLCDQWGFKKILLGAVTVAITLLYSFLFLPLLSPLATVLILGFLGGSLLLMTPLIIAWGNQIIPKSPSTVSALLMGLAWGLSSLVPALAGFLASRFGYISAISTVSLFLVPSLLCLLFIPRTQEVYI